MHSTDSSTSSSGLWDRTSEGRGRWMGGMKGTRRHATESAKIMKERSLQEHYSPE